MDDKTLQRTLALTVFVSSSIAALLLGVLSYVFVVGSLPLGLGTVADDIKKRDDQAIAKEKAAKEKAHAPTEESSYLRLDENFLAGFASELQKEREKLAAEKKAIEEQRKSAQLIKEQADAMQKKVEAKEKDVEELLSKVAQKEKENVADMQKLIVGMASGANLASAVSLLLAFDETMAARILYSMNKKVAAKIIDAAMGDPTQKEQIVKITKRMQTLSDDLKEPAK
jgi:hypothetical protein